MALDNFRRIDMKINRANDYQIETQFAKEGDYNGRELVVQITDAGEVKNQSGVSLNLGWRHDSVGNTGLDPFTVVDITKGIFKIAYPKEMLNAGLATAVIQVVERGKITLTRNFKITVEKNPIDEGAIVSENSFTALTEALVKVNDFDERLAQKVGDGKLATLNDFDEETLNFISDGTGGPININSVPKNKSVTWEKTTFLTTGDNIIDNKKMVVGRLLTTGIFDPNATRYKTTDFIPINPNDSVYFYYASSQALFNPRIFIYDSDDPTRSPIEDITSYVSGTPITNPQARYFRTSIASSVADNMFGASLNELKPHEPFYLKNKDIKFKTSDIIDYDAKNNDKPLTGKTIVNMGDSITESGYYSDKIRELTGATVYNVGFGGTRAAYHGDQRYDAFSLYQLSEAIKNNDFTLQETEIVTLSNKFKARFTELKSIDFNSVDYITINHMQNDYGSNIPIGDEQSLDDGQTFKGALLKACKDIQTAYPHIEILFVSGAFRARFSSAADIPHTNSDVTPNGSGKFLKDYVLAMEEVAKVLHIPFYNMHDNSGINLLTYHLYYTDGLHLNEFGGNKFGRQISNFLSQHS